MKSVLIREIHEIELSSTCNLACRYCPHPKLKRAKAHMEWDVFERTLVHVAHYCEQGTQTEVSLTGIGEAVLHPRFEEALFRVRELIGSRPIAMSTNGVSMTPRLAAILTHFGVIVYLSTHRPEKAGAAWEMLRAARGSIGTNTAFVNSSMDWAGQVKWHVSAPVAQCQYLTLGWGVIRQDGAVNACCMDAHSLHPIATVWDEPGSFVTAPMPLCAGCHLTVPAELREAA